VILACFLATLEFGATTALPLKEGLRIAETLLVDVDGDGVNDIVLAGLDDERRIECWPRRGGPRPWTAPDARLGAVVSDDVIAFAYLRGGGKGRGLHVFTPRSMYRHDPDAKDEDGRFVRELDVELLWPIADPAGPFHLQTFVHDLDGDGADELVLPEPGGYRILARDSGGAWRGARLSLGEEATSRVALERPEVRNRGGAAGLRSRASNSLGLAVEALREPWLELYDSVPAPVVADIDGDGRIDIGALTRTTFQWWRQTGARQYAATAALESNPVERDRGRSLDLSYSARIGDHDGDGRADAVVFAANRRSEKAQTQVLGWRGAKRDGLDALFPKGGAPSQVLVLDGIARAIALEDVDGDRLPDLVAGAVKPDLIDALRAATSERLEAQIYVFLGKRGGWSRRPDLSWTISIKAARFDAQVEVLGDVTGDGLAEILVRSEPESARVLMLKKGRDGSLTLVEKPVWQAAVDPDARLLAPSALTRSAPDILWIGKEGVSCTSFY
jgi:hypothetical protein